jgi:hypothetical protein
MYPPGITPASVILSPKNTTLERFLAGINEKSKQAIRQSVKDAIK